MQTVAYLEKGAQIAALMHVSHGPRLRFQSALCTARQGVDHVSERRRLLAASTMFSIVSRCVESEC